MNKITTTFIASVILMMLSVPLCAQKKTVKGRPAATQVTYPSRDKDFKPEFQLTPIGDFSRDMVESLDYVRVPAPDFKGHMLKRNMNRKQVRLTLLSCKANNITDEDDWVINNGLTPRELKVEFPIHQFAPRYQFNTGGYLVTVYGPHYGETLKLVVTDQEEQKYYAAYDFENFRYSPKTTLMGNVQCVTDVYIEGNIMYVAHGSRSYSDGAGYQTGYLSAFDMENNEILWTTQPMTCNSKFAVVNNSIICGYGFTSEPDNLFILDKYSGQRVQKIPVKKMVERVELKGNKAYVRTYSFDYLFSVIK